MSLAPRKLWTQFYKGGRSGRGKPVLIYEAHFSLKFPLVCGCQKFLKSLVKFLKLCISARNVTGVFYYKCRLGHHCPIFYRYWATTLSGSRYLRGQTPLVVSCWMWALILNLPIYEAVCTLIYISYSSNQTQCSTVIGSIKTLCLGGKGWTPLSGSAICFQHCYIWKTWEVARMLYGLSHGLSYLSCGHAVIDGMIDLI